MPDLTIELPGAQFRRAYLLYIVELCHGKERYFYVGQTGDNKYITARPAFRRLAGHLEDVGQSTQNQVYRYVASDILGYTEGRARGAFNELIKQSVEDYLVGSTLRMHIYEVQRFDPSVAHHRHLQVVRKVSLLEKFVMQAFLTARKNVMNKSKTVPIEPCPYQEMLTRIKTDFTL